MNGISKELRAKLEDMGYEWKPGSKNGRPASARFFVKDIIKLVDEEYISKDIVRRDYVSLENIFKMAKHYRSNDG